MKLSNSEVVAGIEQRKTVSRVGQLRREKMSASRPGESREPDHNQADPVSPARKK